MTTADAPQDHRGLEVLSPGECDRLLGTTPVGRVAFMSKGEPLVLPVNHAYVDGAIVFRTTVGEKLAAAQRGAPMSFEIDGWDAATQTGWSVVVRGVSEAVYASGDVERYESLGLISWAAPGLEARWVRIRPSEITGRALRSAG